MTTPTNPPISLENVRAELGASYPLALNQPSVLQLAGKSGPPISLLDLLGKSHVTSNQLYVRNVVYDENDGVYGFSQGGTGYGPPYSEQTFGSLSGNNVSGNITYALYTYYTVQGANPSFTTYFVTSLSYGQAVFTNWTMGLWNGSAFTKSYLLKFEWILDQTQTYTLTGSDDWLVQYAGQTVTVAMRP